MHSRRLLETIIEALEAHAPNMTDMEAKEEAVLHTAKLRGILDTLPERKKQSNVIQFRTKKKTSRRQQRLIGMLDCSVNEFGDVEYAEA